MDLHFFSPSGSVDYHTKWWWWWIPVFLAGVFVFQMCENITRTFTDNVDDDYTSKIIIVFGCCCLKWRLDGSYIDIVKVYLLIFFFALFCTWSSLIILFDKHETGFCVCCLFFFRDSFFLSVEFDAHYLIPRMIQRIDNCFIDCWFWLGLFVYIVLKKERKAEKSFDWFCFELIKIQWFFYTRLISIFEFCKYFRSF